MTATGNLSRGVVADMCDRFSWPGFDKAGAFQFHKVVNEPDFLPLYFVHHIAQTGTLLHKHKGHLKISPAGRRMLQPPNPRALQAVLFHITMWQFDLGNLGWGLHGWPQRDAGVILWCLSIASNDWQPRERLLRLCTIPLNGVLDQTWDTASHAMEARILRPLQWSGLPEHREDGTESRCFERRHLYRKTALFDRFLSFDVTLEKAGDHHTDRGATLPTDRIPRQKEGQMRRTANLRANGRVRSVADVCDRRNSVRRWPKPDRQLGESGATGGGCPPLPSPDAVPCAPAFGVALSM
jgi:hypothetical protein